MKTVKQTGQFSGTQFLNVPVTSDMIPSARILVYTVAGSQMAADSVWIDVEDTCASKVASFLDWMIEWLGGALVRYWLTEWLIENKHVSAG